MLVLAQALFAVVLSRLPVLLRLRFYPSYAAMTFPFVITATALGKALAFFQANGLAVPEVLNVLFAAEAAVSVVMVGYVFIHYLHFFFMRIEEPKSAAVIRENKPVSYTHLDVYKRQGEVNLVQVSQARHAQLVGRPTQVLHHRAR